MLTLFLALALQASTSFPMPQAGPVAVDAHHPQRGEDVAPRRGGSVVVAVPAAPPSLNALLESSGVARRILYETHERLLRRDWDTWKLEPALASA